MIVANMEDEALLGLDVLMKSQWGPADIKLTDGIILLGGHAIHCTQIGQTNKIIRKIYVADETPPRSEILLDVFVDRFHNDSPETVQNCILEPSENFSERFSFVMAQCLVNISQKVTCKTRIMNPYDYKKTLYQDTVIGSAEVVEHEPKMLLECEDTLEVNNQNAIRRLKFHDSNLMSGKGVSKDEIIRHLTNKEKELTPEPPPTAAEEELLGSPTALELEQEISESQAVHQNLLDYSEQADSLILSEDMDRQSEWSRDQLSILDENLSYYTTCADIVKRIHTGGPAESKKLPKFPPLPKRKLLSLYGEQAKKTKDDDTGRTSPVLDNKRDRCNQNCKKRSLSLFCK
ncbi:unnamed protein product [Mytilus coruscus]|uniref:Uncharacterized protein n=1 Tax=Mytilus coruscus TaxID=42192 RepID=A0A6J8BQN6_MYTCO|nr:unnamed protein product [Mytilus coruscus]